MRVPWSATPPRLSLPQQRGSLTQQWAGPLTANPFALELRHPAVAAARCRSGTALSPAGILQTSPLQNHLPRCLFVVLSIYYLPSSPRRSTVPPRRPIVCPPTAMPTAALPAADGRGIIICAVHIGRAVPAVPACVGRDRAAPPPTVTSPVALPHLLAVALPQFSDECIRSLVFRYLPLVVPISSLYCSVWSWLVWLVTSLGAWPQEQKLQASTPLPHQLS